MNHPTRRQFLQTSAALLSAGLVAPSFDIKKDKPLLSFSTLGCPDWDFQKITDFAAQHGYSGLEIRGLGREMDLPKCKEFNEINISSTINRMNEKGLQFVSLGSSASMHMADATERKKHLDDARRFIDLAQKIGSPCVRVFPNNFLKDQGKKETMELIVKGLLELGNYAKGSKVSVLMETHGDVVSSEDLEKIMQSADHAHTGLVWDITNMWTVTKESPAVMYKRLKKYIRHTHIKDAKLADGKIHYTLLGQGEVPIFEAIDILAKDGYKGYYSFEWEKLWHPEIGEPEIALADYPVVMGNYFK